MADIPGPQATAELNLQEFQRGLQQALAGLKTLDAAMQAVKAGQVTLDTSTLIQQTTAARAQLQTLAAPIVARPTVDTTQFIQGIQQTQQRAQALEAALKQQLIARPTVDTSQLTPGVQQAEQRLTTLGQALRALPPARPLLEAAAFQQQAQTVEQRVNALRDSMRTQLTARPTVETTALQAGVQQALTRVQALGTAMQQQLTARPTVDLGRFQAPLQQAGQAVQRFGELVRTLPVGRPTLNTTAFTQQAQAVEQRVGGLRQAFATQFTLRPTVDSTRFQQGITATEAPLVRLQRLMGAPLTARPQLDNTAFLRSAQQTEQQVVALGRTLQRLPRQRLDVDTTAANRALQALEQQLGQTLGPSQAMVTALGGLGSAGAVAAAGGVAALITAFTLAGKAAAELQHEVAAIATIKPELDLSAVTDALAELSTRLPQSARQLAAGLYDIFSSLNVTQADAVRLLEQIGKGAVAARTDTATFASALTGVLNAYKLSVNDAARASDVFFNTVNAGVVTGQQLAAGLGPLAQSAKAAGVSLEELGALIVGVTKEGGEASQNLNNLNNTLQKLVTKEVAQEFGLLGIAVADAAGNLRSPIQLLTELQAKLEALTPAARAQVLQQIFPDLQARAGLQVLLSQLDTVNEALRVNREELGSTERAYQTMAQTAVSRTQLLENALNALGVEIGRSLTGGAAEVADGARSILEAVTAMVRDTRPLLQAFAAGVAQDIKQTAQAFRDLGAIVGTARDTVLRDLRELQRAWVALRLPTPQAPDADAAKRRVYALLGLNPETIIAAERILRAQLRASADAIEKERTLREKGLQEQRGGERRPEATRAPALQLGLDLGELAGRLRVAEAAADAAMADILADLGQRFQTRAEALGTQGMAQAGAEIVAGLVRGLNQSRTGLGDELDALIHDAASRIAGAWADPATSMAGLQALVDGLKAELSARFPELGDHLVQLITEQILARGGKAFQDAAAMAELFFNRLQEGRTTLDELAAAARTVDLGAILGNPQATQAAIQAVQEYQRTLGEANTLLGQVTDAEVRAAAQRLLNAAAAGQEADALQRAISLLREHAAAQEASAAVQAVGTERATALIQAASAAFTRAQQEQVAALAATKQHTAAAQVALQALGVSDAETAAILGLGNDAFRERVRQLQALAGAASPAEATQKLLNDRYAQLATTLSNELTPAQVGQVQSLIEEGRQYKALEVVAAATGISLERLAALTQQSGQAFQQGKAGLEQWMQTARDLDKIPFTVLAQQLDRLTQTTFPALTAAEQAHVQQLQLLAQWYAEQGDVTEATRLRTEAYAFALGRLGLEFTSVEEVMAATGLSLEESIRLLDDLVHAEERAAEAAKKTAEAYATYNEAVGRANATLAKAQADTGRALEKAAADAQKALQDVADKMDRAAVELAAAMVQINRQIDAARQEAARALAAVAASLSARLRDLARQEADLDTEFWRSAEARQRQFTERLQALWRETGAVGERVAFQMAEAVGQAADAQRSALLQASQQMSDLLAQAQQQASTASQQLEDIERRIQQMGVIQGPELQDLLRERIRLQGQIGFEQVALQRGLDQARASLQEAQLAAQEETARQTTALLRSTHEHRQEQQRQVRELLAERQRAEGEAWQRHQEQLAALQSQREQALSAAYAASLAARAQEKKRLEELEEQKKEIQKRHDEQLAAAEAVRAAIDERTQETRDQIWERRQEAERQHEEALRSQQAHLNKAIAELQTQNGILTDINSKLGVTQQVSTGNIVVQEAAIDMFAEWTAGLRRHMAAGTVG
jgi:TP901 family phage tail tape measure protein